MNELTDVSKEGDPVSIPFTTRNGGRSLVDGTLVIPMAFDPLYSKQAFEFFGGLAGRPGVAVPLTQQAAQKHMQQQTINNYQADVKQLQNKSKYGHFAALLDKGGFWHQLPVLKAIGDEKAYMAWCRHQPCMVSEHHMGGWDMDKGEMRSEYDHVNTAKNSGTGFRNEEYHGLPLCKECHQHFKGQLGCFSRHDETIDKVRQHQHQWARQKLKKTLGFDSWKDVPPLMFYEWAKKFSVHNLVPYQYKMQLEALNHV